jgi:hypothetical protein
MKHFFLTILIALLLVPLISAQTVDSINVEQAGDFIKIRYKILNSTPDQVYRVKVLCSINGGMNTEIRSISGDVGDLVAGGKPEYWVVWDVLKDVEELKSVEFIVRAELIKDLSAYGTKKPLIWANERTHLLALIEIKQPIFGLRFAYCGKWGVSARALYGKREVPWEEYLYDKAAVYSLGLDLTKRIVNSKGFQMHLMAGISSAKMPVADYDISGNVYDYQNHFGLESGILVDIKRISISICLIRFSEQMKEPWELILPSYFFDFGIGARF